MRIGELAKAAGVSARSLRYYEEQRLLTSTRSPSGQRHFRDADIDRVGFIQRLYAAGLSSRTVMELLPCVDAPSEATSDAAMERMEQERERLSAHIEELIRTRDALDGLMATNRAHRKTLRRAPAAPSSGGQPSLEVA